MKPLQDYLLTGSGRLGRRIFILCGLPILLLWISLQLEPVTSLAGHSLGQLACLYLLSCLISQRLHDIGRSGWWTGLIMAGMMFLPVANNWLHLSLPQLLLGPVPIALVLIALVVVPGQMKFNRYGAQPELLIRRELRPVGQAQTPPQTRT